MIIKTELQYTTHQFCRVRIIEIGNAKLMRFQKLNHWTMQPIGNKTYVKIVNGKETFYDTDKKYIEVRS